MKALNRVLRTKYPISRHLVFFNPSRTFCEEERNPARRVLAKLASYSKESKAIENADKIFQSCYVQANRIGFKTLHDFSEEPTNKNFINHKFPFLFNHQILAIHIWLINRRLMHVNKKGDRSTLGEENLSSLGLIFLSFKTRIKDIGRYEKLVQRHIYEILWEDTARRIRAEGIPEISNDARLRDFHKVTHGAAILFDQGLEYTKNNTLSKEPKHSNCRKAFKHIILKNFYKALDEPEKYDKQVDLLIQYLLEQLDNLYLQKVEDIQEGKILWIEPPLFEKILSKEKLSKMKDFSDLKWMPYLDQMGTKFFYHVITRKTSEVDLNEFDDEKEGEVR